MALLSDMHVMLYQGSVWTEINAPLSVLEFLDEQLTVDSPSARHAPAFKYGHWDGKVRFLKRSDGHAFFLAGLTSRVCALLEKAEIKALLKAPIQPSHEPLTEKLARIELRPDQLEGVEIALERRRIVLQQPTGGGKTAMGAEILRRYGAQQALWLVHSTDLFHQTMKDLRAMLPGVPIGEIRPNTNEPGRIVVAMVQTLAKRHPSELATFDALIVDEAHHASAQTWIRIAQNLLRAYLRVGLSGTAKTGEIDRDLRQEGLLGPVVVIRTTGELQVEGILPDAEIVMLEIGANTYPSKEQIRDAVCPGWRSNRMKLIPLGAKLFRYATEQGITRNMARHRAFIKALAFHLRQGQKAVALVNLVEHGEAFVRQLEASQTTIPLFWLHAGVPSVDRKEAYRFFQETDGPVLIVASPVIREGINLPELDVLAWMGGGEAPTMILQAIGRGLRAKEGRPIIRIYDAIDGNDFSEIKDYNAQQTLKRLTLYEDQGFPVIGPVPRSLTSRKH